MPDAWSIATESHFISAGGAKTVGMAVLERRVDKGEARPVEAIRVQIELDKVMAELDIAEKRVPQDGRFKVRVPGKTIDFRVSIMPSVHGEDAVIRILDKQSISEQFTELSLDIVGFPEAELRRLDPEIAVTAGHGHARERDAPLGGAVELARCVVARDTLRFTTLAPPSAALGNVPTIEGVTTVTTDVDFGENVLREGRMQVSSQPGFGLRLNLA